MMPGRRERTVKVVVWLVVGAMMLTVIGSVTLALTN
jgi:hypothetical protein